MRDHAPGFVILLGFRKEACVVCLAMHTATRRKTPAEPVSQGAKMDADQATGRRLAGASQARERRQQLFWPLTGVWPLVY